MMMYRPKILIVDDKLENLFLLESVLTHTEAEIVKATNGDEALRAALHQDFDFALMIFDVKMPIMDGYELAELMRTRKKARHIPIIFLSAVYSDDFHVFKGYESGAVDFLVKPFNDEILLDKVNIFLELDTQKRRLQEVVVELRQSNERLNHEIAERKQVEHQLQQYAAELREANAELSQYAYVVSHDLKAPLRAIHNYTNFLREDLEDSLEEEQQSYLDGLHQAFQEANSLIEDILELSRVGCGQLQSETIDIGAFLASLIQSLDLADDVEIAMDAKWPILTLNVALFRQIFQNLIMNAIKFNTHSPKRVKIGWHPIGDEVYEIFVQDNGIGIEPEYQEKIFRIFERLHHKEEFEGTGIGLAIVKKAVGKLGGSIRVESQPGQGSTFLITFSKLQHHAADL